MKRQKESAYRELGKVIDQVKEKSWNWKTKSSPIPEINNEIIEFINEEINANMYVGIKNGRKELLSGWYEKHTQKQIEAKTQHFYNQLARLEEVIQNAS